MHTEQQHSLPGKDDTLENSLSRMQHIANRLGLNLKPQNWLNPVPSVWSVNLQDADCPLLFSNGKGRSKNAALVSALGEFFERLSTHYFFSDYYYGSRLAGASFVHHPQERWFKEPDSVFLDDVALQAHYFGNPELQPVDMVELNSGQYQRGICALPFTRHSDKRKTWFPVNLINNMFASNGMAAGNTMQEAEVQALSEIMERAVKFRVIGEQLCLPDIPEEILQRYPKIMEGISSLRSSGFNLLIKDASLGGVYPVVNITLVNPQDQGVYANFGAHPCFEVALERTLTELLQGRALDELDNFAPPSLEYEEVSSAENLETHFIDSSGSVSWRYFHRQADFEFYEWDQQQDNNIASQSLYHRLESEGYQVYVARYEHLGIPCCRILVPGFSEVYPVEDLYWENNNQAVELRKQIMKFNDLDPIDSLSLLRTVIERDLDDQYPVMQLLGLAPDPESAWGSLRVGELKVCLAVNGRDMDEVMQGCRWILNFNDLSKDRLDFYRCLLTSLSMDKEHAEHDLASVFGNQTVNRVEKSLSEGRVAEFFPTIRDSLQELVLHTKMLRVLQRSKSLMSEQ